MSLPGRKIFRVAALLGASHLLSASLLAQAATNHPALTPSSSATARPLVSEPPAPPEPVPPLPLARSPISFFRELLAMNAAERKQALTNRSPESRTLILAKVREYESLKPDERELRLRVTELRWYLRPLMTAPATNRAAQLAAIPEPRPQIGRRPVAGMGQAAAGGAKGAVGQRSHPPLPCRNRRPHRRAAAADPQEHPAGAPRRCWKRASTSGMRCPRTSASKMLDRFNQFFELTAPEKEKALKTLSEPERRQIEKTLRTFGSLPPDQRAQCIRSFAKFASLSLDERQQFLKNAERWKLMSPGERQAWRELVRSLPPPLPPDCRRRCRHCRRPRPTPTRGHEPELTACCGRWHRFGFGCRVVGAISFSSLPFSSTL